MTKADLLALLDRKDASISSLRTMPSLVDLVNNARKTALPTPVASPTPVATPTPTVTPPAPTVTLPGVSIPKPGVALPTTGIALPGVGTATSGTAVPTPSATPTPPPPSTTFTAADDTRTVAQDPLLAPLLDQARLYRIADLAKLDAPAADIVVRDVSAPTALDNTTLSRLVTAGTLTEDKASSLGLAATIYAFSDDDARVAAAIAGRAGATGSTRTLAAIDAAGWTATLQAAGVSNPAARAALLARRFAALRPTAALSGRLQPVPSNLATAPAADVLRLTHNYPGLGLSDVLQDAARPAADRTAEVTRRVALVGRALAALDAVELTDLDLVPGSPDLARFALPADQDGARVLASLKAYQRTLAWTRDADDAKVLLDAGITSAHDAALRPLSLFRAATGLDETKANLLWQSANRIAAASGTAFGSALDLRYGMFGKLRVGNLPPTVEDTFRRLSGYQALFGSLDFCTCAHCQSILGPAAYFVDLMRFVEVNILAQLGDRTGHPLDLHTRRSDLWTLDLTCANSEDSIPTLQIVNEVLETFVAGATLKERLIPKRKKIVADFDISFPASGRTPTPGPQPKRPLPFGSGPVEPKAVERSIYELLADTADSFTQPFSLPLTRIHLYLDQLGSTRSEVRRALGATREAAAPDVLRLSAREWGLVTHPVTTIADLRTLYDLPFPLDGSAIAPVDAHDLAEVMGLDRGGLETLLGTHTVPGAGTPPRIVAGKRDARSVQNDVERVTGLTVAVLDRMHRFTRLSRALPWSMSELDRVLVALGDTALAAAAPVHVAAVREIQSTLGLSPDEACAMIGAIPREPTGDSLFDRLFNPPGLAPDARLPRATGRFVHPAFRQTTDVAPEPALASLLAGLGLDLAGLEALIRPLATRLGFVPDDPDEAARGFLLDEAHLALLYRHARLARALGLSIPELFLLINVAGMSGPSIDDLGEATTLLDVHAQARATGYSLDDLAVATGRTPLDGSRYLDAQAAAAALADGAAAALSFRDTIFAVALGIPEQASRDLLTSHAALFTTTGDGSFRLAPGVDLAAESFAPLPAGIDAAGLRAALSPYDPQALLRARLGQLLGASGDKVAALARLAGHPLGDAALARALVATPPGPELAALTTALRPLAVAFQAAEWDADAIDFVRGAPARFAVGPGALTFAALLSLDAYARLARAAAAPGTPAASPADVRAALALFDGHRFPATATAAVARAIRANPGMVSALRAAALPTVAARALDALASAARLATTLGIDGEVAAALGHDDFASLSHAADALLAAIHAHNRDTTALAAALDPIDETLRERRRDALVAYLLHSFTRGTFRDRDDLVRYFLIDVDAGGCATTSRVVSAISTVQQFVQRVILGLEQSPPDASDPISFALDAEPAAEWSWRQSYRVWEVNRKVFLWPENYIEPDLRDDKTPLFQELETELLQTDLTDLDVADAYAKYLKGFEEVASLSLAGAYHDVHVDGDTTQDVLHLFGVASTDPPTYYYRTCENLIASGRDPNLGVLYTPWQKIGAQIAARRVSPVVFDGRLHLFWPQIRTRPLTQVISGNSQFTGYDHTMQVKFATLRPDGTWTIPQPVDIPAAAPFLNGKGVIRDGFTTTLPAGGGRPKFADENHPEPREDYTISGPNWDWLWLEPAKTGAGPAVRATFRNFTAFRTVDLYRRTFADVTFPVESSLRRPPGLRLHSNTSDGLHAAGSRAALGGMAIMGEAAFANLLLDDGRRAVSQREGTDVVGVLMIVDKLAQIPTGSDLLALPGSIEDLLIQTGPDLLLLQSSVTDDDRRVLRRLGTTLAADVSRTLLLEGVEGLLALSTQSDLREAPIQLTGVSTRVVDRTNAGRLDFTGPYGVHYRELFFHIPFLIANALNSRGRFEAAQRWYHFIFDPTTTDPFRVAPGVPADLAAAARADRVWRYLEFRRFGDDSLRDILTDDAALAAYRQDPFNPHAIARVRISAYQKSVFMKYLDNLLDWADHLFTQFTTESVNEALSLYLTARELLGPRPAQLGACGEAAVKPRSYEAIAPTLGQGNEVLVELETWVYGKRAATKRLSSAAATRFGGYEAARVLRAVSAAPALSATAAPATTSAPASSDSTLFKGLTRGTPIAGWGPALGARTTLTGTTSSDQVISLGRARLSTVAEFTAAISRQVGPVFCIPANQDLLGYWDRVEDRLSKIRHCQNIDGERRDLALFAPEIDPRLLVRLRAEGLSLEDVLSATSGELPPYRFQYLIERAKGLAAGLSSYGSALLSALEKKDAEELGHLRQVHQQNLTRMSTQLRRWEIDAAEAALAAVDEQIATATFRSTTHKNYLDRDRTANEIAQSVSRHLVTSIRVGEAGFFSAAVIAALIIQGGSPFSLKWGGAELARSLNSAGYVVRALASAADAVSQSTGLEAGFERRRQGWDYQKRLADHDVTMLKKQRAAASTRIDIARRSLEIHEKSIDQLDEQLDLFERKFSNLGLYTYLSALIRRTYRAAYQNALALARLAERAYRFERPDDDSPGLAASYWGDPTRAGLFAGEQLLVDLQSLERRYLETNYRCLEIDQPFALSQIDPAALLALRETGTCEFTVPELAFDLAYRGHYRRRIRSVRLTIPCVTGPYVNVSAVLSLLQSWIRPQPSLAAPLEVMPPSRSVSVAASTAQNDAGVFELSFRDERYMPFEGAGAVSRWRLVLPGNFRQFDYQSMSDVILSIAYTADESGTLRNDVEREVGALEAAIVRRLESEPMGRAFSLRQDFSGPFTRLLHSPLSTAIRFELTDGNFPQLAKGREITVSRSAILVRTAESASGAPVDPGSLRLSLDGADLTGFRPDASLGGLFAVSPLPPAFTANPRQPHTLLLKDAGGLAPRSRPPGDVSPLDADLVLDVILYLEFRILPRR